MHNICYVSNARFLIRLMAPEGNQCNASTVLPMTEHITYSLMQFLHSQRRLVVGNGAINDLNIFSAGLRTRKSA